MRIDSSGNLMVGTTDSTPASSSSGSGISLRENGSIEASRDGSAPLFLNRSSSDGKIIDLYKDGTTVGTIGSRQGRMYLHSPSPTGSGIRMGAAFIMPCDSDGSDSDNDTNLGQANSRFQDLYLGGGLYVGGTGTANKLDDYEEGTWTPTFQASGNHYTSVTYGTRLGTYTKIGRMVIAAFRVQLSAINTSNGTGGIQIESLPFTSLNTTNLTQTGSIDFVNNVDINAGSFGTLNLSIGLNPNDNKSRIIRTRNNANSDLIPASSATNSTDIAGVLIYAVD